MQINVFWGSVRDPAGGAYSALPDSLGGISEEEKGGTGEKGGKDTGGEQSRGNWRE